MKKLVYTNPDIEIVRFDEDDIMTASTTIYDKEGILDGEPTDKWWD